MIQGAAEGDQFGDSVSGAGDVNKDGFSDIIVGATRASPNGRYCAGAVYVFFGRAGGFSTVDLVGFVSSDSTGFMIQGASVGFSLGTSVSGTGDVNGDGCDDIIVGAFGAGSISQARVGVAYHILGKATGFTTVDLLEFSSSDSTGYIIQGAAGGDYLGWSVSGAGDVNKDGLADVLVGASGASPNGRTNAGAVYVV
ncbi:hypothetical protein B484DRAFT_389239 [Ochromonadaceae sp. CCMP2298]|nr:hypothetical protein B484DRAFT_389239 [Ochromonadaceae sp. CCMP2298]